MLLLHKTFLGRSLTINYKRVHCSHAKFRFFFNRASAHGT